MNFQGFLFILEMLEKQQKSKITFHQTPISSTSRYPHALVAPCQSYHDTAPKTHQLGVERFAHLLQLLRLLLGQLFCLGDLGSALLLSGLDELLPPVLCRLDLCFRDGHVVSAHCLDLLSVCSLQPTLPFWVLPF